MFSVMLSTRFFISLGHTFVHVPADRDFLEMKQENKHTKTAAWGWGTVAVVIGISQIMKSWTQTSV
jgi:hypothetical protein